MNLQTITQNIKVLFSPRGYNCMLGEGALKTEENAINHGGLGLGLSVLCSLEQRDQQGFSFPLLRVVIYQEQILWHKSNTLTSEGSCSTKQPKRIGVPSGKN